MQTSQLSTQNITTMMGPIEEFLKSRTKKGPAASGDLESFERDLGEACAEFQRSVIHEELKRYDVEAKAVDVGGIEYRLCLKSKATYLTSAGHVEIERSLFRSASGERAICPLELRAGIMAEYWTPLAARRGAWMVQQMTPQSAEAAFQEMGVMRPSRASLDRLPKILSERWEAHREEWEGALRLLETVPIEATSVAISLDGVMAPMRDGCRAEKRNQPDKQPKGPAGFKEVGCGTISLYGPAPEIPVVPPVEGEQTREGPPRLQTVRYARMPEKKKETLKRQLEEEMKSIMAVLPDLKVAKLADGARDNWDYLSSDRLPTGKEIIDNCHASEHLKKALDTCYGEGSIEAKKNFASLKIVLRDEENGVDKVIATLAYRGGRCHKNKRKLIAKETKYFRRNRARMRYWEYQKEGYPIGSGVVEAACKTLVTQRMKNSGMRWRQPGGQAILTLRSLVQSERWAAGWDLLSKSYQRRVSIRIPMTSNVISFERKAA